MKLIKLQTLYNRYLEQYKSTKSRNHPHPSELLALLLLQDKDEYSVDKIPIGSFYKVYKTPIDAKIAKVISDFELTEDEIKSYAIGLDPRLKVSDEQIKRKMIADFEEELKRRGPQFKSIPQQKNEPDVAMAINGTLIW